MQTKLTRLLGIKYPIIQGGMAWTSDAVLAAAVSNAGGAGIIGSGGRTVDWTREEVRKAKTLTNKPFGVNVMLMAPNIAEIIDMLCEEKVAFVTLGAGNPVPHIEKFHAAGIKVIPCPMLSWLSVLKLQELMLWLSRVWKPVVTLANKPQWL